MRAIDPEANTRGDAYPRASGEAHTEGALDGPDAYVDRVIGGRARRDGFGTGSGQHLGAVAVADELVADDRHRRRQRQHEEAGGDGSVGGGHDDRRRR